MVRTRRGLALSRRRDQPSGQRRVTQKDEQSSVIRVSPLERLPTELLYDIVEIYLCFDQERSITTITQICHRIRQVVLGMADVWRNITLLPPYNLTAPAYRRYGVRHLFCILLVYSFIDRVGSYAIHKSNSRLYSSRRGPVQLTFVSTGQLQMECWS
jgi:hypothetical protein